MADLFNQDFQEFIEALNIVKVEYILVGGYAVILHGYIRSTADMDVWVNKTSDNYVRLRKAFDLFGAPVFSEKDFLGNEADVWAIGIEYCSILQSCLVTILKIINISQPNIVRFQYF